LGREKKEKRSRSYLQRKREVPSEKGIKERRKVDLLQIGKGKKKKKKKGTTRKKENPAHTLKKKRKGGVFPVGALEQGKKREGRDLVGDEGGKNKRGEVWPKERKRRRSGLHWEGVREEDEPEEKSFLDGTVGRCKGKNRTGVCNKKNKKRKETSVLKKEREHTTQLIAN